MMDNELPKSIKIGAHQWKLRSGGKEDLRLKDASKYGETDELHLSITIDSTLLYERQVGSLLHEILHAVESTWLSSRDRSAESVITANAAGLLQVLRDNPSIVSFILAEGEGKVSE